MRHNIQLIKISRVARNRRGQDASLQYRSLIIAALSVVALIVILTVILKINTTITNEFEDAQCRFSVQKAAALRLTQINAFEGQITCQTKIKTLHENNPDTTNQIIAQAMAGCWKNWLEGKEQYFKEAGTYCFPCSVLTFSPKSGDVTGLAAYLTDTIMPESNITYADYLQGYQTTKAQEFAPALKAAQIPSMPRNETYAILFVHVEGSDELQTFNNKATAASAGTAVGGAGLYLVFGVTGGIIGGVATIIGAPLIIAGGAVLLITTQTSIFDSKPERSSQVIIVHYIPDALKLFNCKVPNTHN